MNQEEKRLIDNEILDIVSFHLKVLKIKESKESIKLALSMFIEGVKYIKKKEIERRGLRAKAWNAKTFKKWTRKGRCPGCGAGCGSDHQPNCWVRKELLESLKNKRNEI